MRKNHHFLVFVSTLLAVFWTNQTRANAPTGQYVISNGVVFDNKSQLSWEQNPDLTQVTFDQAKMYCQSLTLAGATWRVPSIKELQSIIDETLVDPAVDPTAFPNTPLDKYWSSSLYAGGSTEAWEVHFDYGATGTDPTDSLHYVRCVH